MSKIEFNGDVAIITGAGRGLGRSYAIALAARGARVVVNDPGVSLDGAGGDEAPANEVVREIEEAGGQAVASYVPVGTEEAAKELVDLAVSSFGRVDILVNNAGTFTPMHSFLETTTESFENLYRVHVLGAIHNSRAVWPLMAAQHYGKIINITSSVGYIGTPGRLEYGTAKGAVHGFTRTLSKESLESGIFVNAVAPGAMTRPVLASSDNFPDEMKTAFSPDLVAPAVVWLASRETNVNGEVFSVTAGTAARLMVAETYGYGSDELTPEDIRDNYATVAFVDEAALPDLRFFKDGEEQGMEMVARFGNRRVSESQGTK